MFSTKKSWLRSTTWQCEWTYLFTIFPQLTSYTIYFIPLENYWSNLCQIKLKFDFVIYLSDVIFCLQCPFSANQRPPAGIPLSMQRFQHPAHQPHYPQFSQQQPQQLQQPQHHIQQQQQPIQQTVPSWEFCVFDIGCQIFIVLFYCLSICLLLYLIHVLFWPE